MRQLRAAKTAPSDTLTSIEHVADTWEVDPKTVEKKKATLYFAETQEARRKDLNR